ncbi:MAG TPA: hypothetical protein HA263_03765 [Methanoregulaceae archaeon]|nr:hypothetical protein [Methanoregulaceae archaeon]
MKDLVTSTRRGLSTPYLRNGTESIRLVKAKDIASDGMLLIDTVDKEQVRRTAALDRARLTSGDVLVTVAGSRFRATVVHEVAEDLVASNSLIALSFDRTQVLPEFAAWYLNSSRGQADIQRWASGAVMQSINTAALLAVTIPVPSMEKQQHLVNLLQVIGSYQEVLKREAALLEKITDSLVEDVNRE